jgi:hypothetical protein
MQMRGELWLALLFIGSPALAQDCEIPLEVRSVTPANEATDVPIDSRVLVSFIGQGSADEFQVDMEANGESISTSKESWCYPHEGPFEVHCWWALLPEDPLPATEQIQIRIQSTSSYQGEEPIDRIELFTTGVGVTEPNLTAEPSLEVLEVIDIPESELTTCDFAQPRRAIIQVDSDLSDPHGLSVFQIEELTVDGSYFRAHTVFMTLSAPPFPDHHNMIKQYVNLEQSYTGCYRISAEDGAGVATESGKICWPEYGDTGVDTSQDTGVDTSQDTAVDTSQDTAGETGQETGADSAQETGTPGSGAVPPNISCGCSAGPSGKAAWCWGLVLLALVRTRLVSMRRA